MGKIEIFFEKQLLFFKLEKVADNQSSETSQGLYFKDFTIASKFIFKAANKSMRLLTVCSYNAPYAFQSESTLYICLNVKKLLARNRREIWSLSHCNETRTYNHLVHKRTLSHLAKWSNDWVVLWVIICTVHLNLCSYLVTYAFQSEITLCKSTLYVQLSVRLRTKWLWVWVFLRSLKVQISRLFRARNSLTFRQIQSVSSLWNTYVTW